MTHEEALDLVHAGHDGPLDERARAGLEAHLAGCERCRGVAAIYGTVHEALREETAHLATDEIVAYVTDRDARAPDERERVEAHAATCASCRDQIARVEQVHDSVKADPGGRGTSRPSARRPWYAGPWLAAAAALFAVALLYPAYLGVYRFPSAARQAESAQNELESLRGWSGPAKLELITAGLRDLSDAPVVEIGPGQPFVILGVQVVVTGDVPDDARIRFEVLDPARGTVASMQLTARETREQVRSEGFVTWLVPSGNLEAGEHRIRVGRPDGAILLEVPVTVRRTDDRLSEPR
jgi:anti-sigma factor RsiW